MINFEVVTLFPSLFEEHIKHLPFKKAQEIGPLLFSSHSFPTNLLSLQMEILQKLN